MIDLSQQIEQLVLAVHRRNGGRLAKLDFSARLLDPVLRLDSLDLAEIMASVQKELGVSPFESNTPPRTWADVLAAVQRGETNIRRADTHRGRSARTKRRTRG
jgi:acyl carrier protein